MPITPDHFREHLGSIRTRLVDQGMLVSELAEQVFASIYDRDSTSASSVLERDDEVDQADIEIERDAVDLMTRAAHDTCPVEAAQIRSLLTAVKVNNELERVADAASAIATRVIALGDRESAFPRTTQVMTNSIASVLRETVKAFRDIDAKRARAVLSSEGNTLSFHELITRDAESRVADGRMGVDDAFDLHAIINQVVIIGDHCSNIAEQVIYEATGTIVRHTDAGWVEQHLPGLSADDRDASV
ncbi:MAG: phosphate signaling complex PhoU family protein [Phycisphaerales bacterium]